MARIVFPDYPTKLQTSKTRRKKYFMDGDAIPKKYQGDNFVFKKGKLYDSQAKEFIVKNAQFVNKPRYQHLSYNKISTPMKVPVLIKLKEWMSMYMPSTLDIKGPLAVSAVVYDWPIPLNKDLDNMHIYYKAFLDLLKDRGMIIDDSKQYISRAGGFRFIPITASSDRKLVFDIEPETSELLTTHMMYNLEPKEAERVSHTEFKHFRLETSEEPEPGTFGIDDNVLLCNFGKTKVIKANADKIFRNLFSYALNYNTPIVVGEEFYRIHADRINRFLLFGGIQVYIKR